MENKYISKQVKLPLVVCFVFLGVCLLLTSSSVMCTYSAYDEAAVSGEVAVGDFVVRQGNGYESMIIKQLSNSRYSHIGLIIQTKPTILVIHATTDDKADSPNQVIVSTLAEFASPTLASSWAVYRNDRLTDQDINQLVNQTKDQLGKPFELYTQHEQAQGFYCTTLIANHLPFSVSQSLIWQEIDVPSLHGKMLYPNALIDSRIGSRAIYAVQ